MHATLRQLITAPVLLLTLAMLCSNVLAQGTATGPFTIHDVESGPVVNIGSLIDPIPIDLDPNGSPWFKSVNDPGFITGPTDLMLNETIINVGAEPWYDWHEFILDPPFSVPQSTWLDVKVLVNGSAIGFSSSGLGTPSLDLFDFSQPVLPGDILQLQKIVQVYDTTGVSGAFLRIQEYPTPEPASAVLAIAGAASLLLRQRERN